MQSDVLKVQADNLAPALDFVEKTVRYIGYSEEYGARMRLLTEEVISAVKPLLHDVDATLHLDTDAAQMRVHLELTGTFSDATRDRLVALSKSHHNEPPKGFFARLGAFFTDAFMADTSGYVPLMADNGETIENYWLLLNLPQESAKPMPKDELAGIEANILRGMADDVKVSARPSHAELIVLKKLPR